MPMASRRACSRKATSSARSSSVSPGKPTMKFERMPASGASARMRRHQLQEAFAVAEAAHAAQQGAAGVLEGHVEVGHDAGGAGEDVDESGADLGGLQVADTDPFDPGDRGERGAGASPGARRSPRSLP